MQILYNGFHRILGRSLYTYLQPLSCQELMNSVGRSHGSLLQLFVMKVEGLTPLWATLIRLRLHSLSCYLFKLLFVERDFSAILWTYLVCFLSWRSGPSSCCCLNISYEPISEAPCSCCLRTLYSQLHGHFCACLFCFEILVGIMSFNCSCIILAPIWLFNQVFNHTLSLQCYNVEGAFRFNLPPSSLSSIVTE